MFPKILEVVAGQSYQPPLSHHCPHPLTTNSRGLLSSFFFVVEDIEISGKNP